MTIAVKSFTNKVDGPADVQMRGRSTFEDYKSNERQFLLNQQQKTTLLKGKYLRPLTTGQAIKLNWIA